METPVLSKSDKAKSLSAGKKLKKNVLSKRIRNVLDTTQTFKCQHLNIEISKSIKMKLNNIFQYEKPKSIKWSLLKNTSKEKRKEFKKQFTQHFKPVRDVPDSRLYIVLGINEVSRLIENKKSILVLLAEDINPKIMFRHILQASKTFKIPVRLVPNLRQITKNCFGFSSCAMAFKQIPSSDPLSAIITSILPDYPASSETSSDEIESEEDTLVENENNTNITESSVSNNESASVSNTESSVSRDIYLYKDKSKKERQFIPPKSTEIRASEKRETENENMDFIQFSDDVLMEENDNGAEIVVDKLKGKKNKKKVYRNLKIKRLAPNQNRIKKVKKINLKKTIDKM